MFTKFTVGIQYYRPLNTEICDIGCSSWHSLYTIKRAIPSFKLLQIEMNLKNPKKSEIIETYT